MGVDEMTFNENQSDGVSQFRGFGSEDNGSLFNFGGNQTFKERLAQRKEKNIANMNLAKFRRIVQKKDTGN